MSMCPKAGGGTRPWARFFSIRLRVKRGQARTGADGIALIESHLRDAPRLPKSQLNFADVDVAVEAQ